LILDFESTGLDFGEAGRGRLHRRRIAMRFGEPLFDYRQPFFERFNLLQQVLFPFGGGVITRLGRRNYDR